MDKKQVLESVERAISRVEGHLGGSRDPSLPNYMDSQVRNFQETLWKMKASLELPEENRVSGRYMAFAIADGWPFVSELGKLICEAEQLYHSMKEGD